MSPLQSLFNVAPQAAQNSRVMHLQKKCPICIARWENARLYNTCLEDTWVNRGSQSNEIIGEKMVLEKGEMAATESS